MRIVMTTDSVGGVWAYTVELCRALGRYGFEVVLACMGGKPAADARSEATALSNVTLYESTYRLEWMEDCWDDVSRAGDWLHALLQKSRGDLLHLNCYGPAIRLYGVPVLLVTHSCVHSWWRATRRAEPDGKDGSWQQYRDCVIQALGSADSVIAPSASILQAIGSCYPEAKLEQRAEVIYNGVDTGRWTELREPASPFVLGVGRIWDEGKNLQQLVGIAPHLPCPVLIAGEGQLRDTDELANVVLLGSLPRKRLLSCYRRAAVFAHPARYEPFGLAVLEAALCGCPLLLGDIPSLRELWHGAAIFVDPADSAAWRNELQRLLDDPAERSLLGRKARKRALRYSATAMAAAYAAKYQSLLNVPVQGVA